VWPPFLEERVETKPRNFICTSPFILNYKTFWFFSRYIAFAMHLDIHYVQIYSKNNRSRKTKMSYNLEQMEYEDSSCSHHLRSHF